MKLLLLLALTSVVLAKDFEGTATVVCPTTDYDLSQCRPSVTGGLLGGAQCAFSCNWFQVLDSFNPDLSGETVTINLPCDCIELTGCPETCEYSSIEDDSVALETFQGPGVLRCPILEYFSEGCEPDSSACSILEDCGSGLDFDFNLFDFTKATIPLNCECVTATCPSSCVLEELTPSFRGPGVITCPEDDYLEEACLPTRRWFQDCDRTGCNPFSFLDGSVVNKTDDGTVEITVPCDCWEADNCPSSCTFVEGLPERTTTEVVEFQGPGVLRCPIFDYITEGCEPDTSACDDPACDSTFRFDFSLLDFRSFAIPLNCDCVVASCPSSCELEPLKPSYRGPGTITCPIDDFFESPCIPFPRAFRGCDDSTCNPLSFLGVSLNETDDGSISIPIPCECWEAANCAETCSFDNETLSMDFDTVDFTGPGIVSCPWTSFLQSPCLPTITEDTCEECLSLRSILESTNMVGSIELPLACDCISVNNCHEDCSFEAIETTNPVMLADGAAFSGRGEVTCPAEDYSQQPCIPVVTEVAISLGDDALDCVSSLFRVPEEAVGDSFQFDIPCDGMELQNCADSCSFLPLELDSDTTSPMDGATTAPVDAPTRVPTNQPTLAPIVPGSPTGVPTNQPTLAPIVPGSPTGAPTKAPTVAPIGLGSPTILPATQKTVGPTNSDGNQPTSSSTREQGTSAAAVSLGSMSLLLVAAAGMFL